MLLQTLGIACGFEPVTFTKAIGIACLIATAFGARAVTRQPATASRAGRPDPAYACAASSYLVDWTVLGLETPLHVAAIVLCPLALSNAIASPSRKASALAVLAVVTLGTSHPSQRSTSS